MLTTPTNTTLARSRANVAASSSGSLSPLWAQIRMASNPSPPVKVRPVSAACSRSVAEPPIVCASSTLAASTSTPNVSHPAARAI